MSQRFLSTETVLRIHARNLEAFGGPAGIVDPGAVESAVVAAQNHHNYTGGDLFDLAAVLLWHLASDHPFADGNKRTALASALVFLAINGVGLMQDDDRFESLTLAVARGEMKKDQVAERLRSAART
ncbi:MAG TPA: type II toxin-antitoxin system death-on-curing family toxin [Holophaga sp.]|nr:type II toxin-antitoxin system death-on-curing family toxin [Holophaga sp.]